MPVVAGIVGIGALLLALVAVLWIYANRQLFDSLVRALGEGIPLIGGAVTDFMLGVEARAFGYAFNWARQAVQPLVDLVVRVDTRHRAFVSENTQTHRAQADASFHLHFEVLPAAIRDLDLYIQTVAASEQRYTDALFSRAEADARQLAQAAEQYAAQLAQAVAARGDAELVAAERALLADLGALAGYARGLALDAEQRATAQAQQVATFAAAEATLDRRYSEQLTRQAEDYARQLAGESQDYARGLSLQDRQEAEQRAAEVAAGAAAAAGVVAAALAAVESSPCMRYCDPLGNLGAGLQDLDLAALVALVAEAAANPQGTAQLISETLGPVAEEGRKLAHDLLSSKL